MQKLLLPTTPDDYRSLVATIIAWGSATGDGWDGHHFTYHGEGVFEVVEAGQFLVVVEIEGARRVRNAEGGAGEAARLSLDGKGNKVESGT